MQNKRNYIQPTIKVVEFNIENGFQISGIHTPLDNDNRIVMGLENMSDNGTYFFGSESNDNGSMMEGIGDHWYDEF